MEKLALSVMAVLLCFTLHAGDGLGKASPESRGMNSRNLGQLDRVIEEEIDAKTIPGAVVSVVKDGKIVYLKAYGNKQVVPAVVPMTTETIFDLASVSKCVGTTLSFLQLVEKGHVRLSDQVSRYIPGFKPWVDPDTAEKVGITIQQLLSHSSGLDPYIPVQAYLKEYGGNSPDSLMSYIAVRAKRNFRPGTGCLYSCLNFITLQGILEKVTGEKLCDYAQKNVFDVLGLKHTCYLPLDRKNDKALLALCAPTEVQADGLPLIGQVHDPTARRVNMGNSGNAGVFSNAEDLSLIAACIMNHGEWNGHRVLGPATIDLMCSVPPLDDSSVGRSYGWDKDGIAAGTRGDLFRAEDCIWHTGYTGTSILIDMKHKVAVILLTNRVHPEDKGSLARLRALVSNIVAGAMEQ